MNNNITTPTETKVTQAVILQAIYLFRTPLPHWPGNTPTSSNSMLFPIFRLPYHTP